MIGIAALAAALSGGGAPPAPDAAPGPDLWLRDYEEAQTLARKTRKPLFVVFRCER